MNNMNRGVAKSKDYKYKPTPLYETRDKNEPTFQQKLVNTEHTEIIFQNRDLRQYA